MPCHDSRNDLAYSVVSQYHDEIRELRQRNDKLMRTICAVDSTMRFTDTQLNSFGQEAKGVILNHRKYDTKRKVK